MFFFNDFRLNREGSHAWLSKTCFDRMRPLPPVLISSILVMKMSLDIVRHSWTINLCNLCNLRILRILCILCILCSTSHCLKIFYVWVAQLSAISSPRTSCQERLSVCWAKTPDCLFYTFRSASTVNRDRLNIRWFSIFLIKMACSACWSSFCGILHIPGDLILDKHLICGVKDFAPPTVTNTGSLAPTVKTVDVSAI